MLLFGNTRMAHDYDCYSILLSCRETNYPSTCIHLYKDVATKMLLEQRKQLKSNQPHRWWGNMVRTQTGFTWLSKPHRVCSVFDLELWPNWRAQPFFPNYGSSAVSVETMLRPSPTMRPEEVYEPGIWAVSLHILSSLVPTCDKNIDCSMTWKLLDPRNGPSNSMTKFVLFPFWAVAIAITPPVVEGVHPASCDAGWSYDRFGATLELAGGWWRVRWKIGCPATLEDYRSKGTTGILFSKKSPKVSREVKIYLSLQIRWCFRSWRTPEVFWITYDAAAGNVLAMTGHGSPRMFEGFNDLRWCRNEIFMVLFLQSSVFVLNVQYLHMQHWAHEQHFAALSCWKVSGLRLFGYHFQDQNALLDVWGVQTYMSNIPKTQRWFGSIFETPHQKQIHHDEHPFVYPWMLSGVWFWSEYFCQVFMGNCKKADFVMLKIFHERVDRFTTQILRWRPQIQVTLLSNHPENSRKPKDPPKCETKFTCCEFFL